MTWTAKESPPPPGNEKDTGRIQAQQPTCGCQLAESWFTALCCPGWSGSQFGSESQICLLGQMKSNSVTGQEFSIGYYCY